MHVRLADGCAPQLVLPAAVERSEVLRTAHAYGAASDAVPVPFCAAAWESWTDGTASSCNNLGHLLIVVEVRLAAVWHMLAN